MNHEGKNINLQSKIYLQQFHEIKGIDALNAPIAFI
jgi:hypothetical protein